MKKFQANLEGILTQELREALGLRYEWGSVSPEASFEVDGKRATISASQESAGGLWTVAVEGPAGGSVVFHFNS